MGASRTIRHELSITALVTGLRMAGAALSFGLATYLSVMLGAEDVGRFYAALSWATGLAIVALWGFPQWVLHEIPPLISRERQLVIGPVLRKMFLGNLGRMVLILFPAMIVAWSIGLLDAQSKMSVPLMFAACAGVLLLIVRTVCTAAKALGFPAGAIALEFVAVPAAALVLYLIIAPATAEALSYVAQSYAVILALTAAIGAAVLAKRLPGLRRSRLPSSQGANLRRTTFAQIEIGQFLTALGAVAFLPLVLPPADVGVLNLVLRIAGLVSLVTATIPSIFLPRLAAAQSAGDASGFAHTLSNMRLIMGFAAIVSYVGIIALGPAILRWAGPDFAIGVAALPWAAAGFCGAMALGPAGTELTLLGHEKVMRDTILPLGIIGILACLLAGALGGPVLAAAMPGAAAFAARLIQLRALRKLRIRPPATGGSAIDAEGGRR